MRVPLVALLCLCIASARARETPASPLSGRWLVAITPPNRGETVFRMQFEQTGPNSWTARSRTGVARALVSRPKSLLDRLFRKMPADGALVYVDAGSIDTVDGLPRLIGMLQGPVFGSFHMEARLTGQTMRGELRRDSLGPRVGDLQAVPDSTDRTLRDYPAVAANIRRELTAHIFDPRLARTDRFRSFLDALDQDFREARDDLDAIAAFHSRARRVGTVRIDLLRDPLLATQPLEAHVNRRPGPPDSLVQLGFPAPGVAYLVARAWNQVTPAIDRAFRRIDSARAHTLVLDVRSNHGGDNPAGSPLAHLYRDSADIGVLLTKKWLATHTAPPTAQQRKSLPVVTRDDGTELINTLRDSGAVVVRVRSRAPYFGGKVFVLADGGTASASEPLAHHLKVTGRATLVGMRTAGAVLTVLPHNVGDHFVLLVPEADHYAADGTRLEGSGVTPHIATTSREAPLAAAREIEKYEPADGAIFVAVTAIPLARWDTAFAALERALARRPNDPAALYQLGSVAAMSQQRLDRGEQALRAYLALPHRPGLASHSVAHVRLGMIHQARGDTEAARRAYASALQLDPKNADALAALGALNTAKPE